MTASGGPRVFWKEVAVVPREGGWAVTLDGRPVHTPGRRAVIVPTEALAEALAGEWRAQEEHVDPLSMPLTRLVNAVLDRVVPRRAEVAARIAGYAESDLLCHRAPHPEALARAQAEAWDPLLLWLRERHGAQLVPTVGVMPVAQPAEALARLRAVVEGLDSFRLGVLHELVTLAGSLVLGLAALEAVRPAEEIWELSRLDERWNERHWGVDREARAGEQVKRRDFMTAMRLVRHLDRQESGPSGRSSSDVRP